MYILCPPEASALGGNTPSPYGMVRTRENAYTGRTWSGWRVVFVLIGPERCFCNADASGVVNEQHL